MNTTSTLGFLVAFAILMPIVGCAGEGSGVAIEPGAAGGVGGAAGGASGGGTNDDAGNGGAGGSPNVDAGNGDTGGSPTCYPATGTAPECASLELCSSAVPAIHADASNCQPGQCAWTLQPNAGDTLTYENDQGWFFLRISSPDPVVT